MHGKPVRFVDIALLLLQFCALSSCASPHARSVACSGPLRPINSAPGPEVPLVQAQDGGVRVAGR